MVKKTYTEIEKEMKEFYTDKYDHIRNLKLIKTRLIDNYGESMDNISVYRLDRLIFDMEQEIHLTILREMI